MKRALLLAALAASLSACARQSPGPAWTFVPPGVESDDLPVAALSAGDRAAWMSSIKRSMMKPGCCGSCEAFTIEDAREVWSYVNAPAPAARTGRARDAWARHWRRLANEFLELDPVRFRHLYPYWPKGGPT